MRVRLMVLALLLVLLAPLVIAGGAVMANRLHVPAVVEAARVTGAAPPPADRGARLSLVSWNIGYAGMGAEADFVMDGGSQMRPTSAGLVDRNLSLIVKELGALGADIYLVQEAAKPSWNTWRRDVLTPLEQALPGHQSMFGADVNTRWVPPPFNVRVGNAILSRLPIEAAERRGLPLEPTFTWGLFRKGYRMHIVRIGGPKGWVIVNIHLSTFDTPQDNVRERQVAEVIRFAEAEYARGAHVVVGGDWNLRLADTEFPHRSAPEHLFWVRSFPKDLLPEGWTLAADPRVPSVRGAHAPYSAGQNFTLVIDGFLVSPNVAVESVQTRDLGFAFTDHHPVRAVMRQR